MKTRKIIHRPRPAEDGPSSGHQNDACQAGEKSEHIGGFHSQARRKQAEANTQDEQHCTGESCRRGDPPETFQISRVPSHVEKDHCDHRDDITVRVLIGIPEIEPEPGE